MSRLKTKTGDKGRKKKKETKSHFFLHTQTFFFVFKGKNYLIL